MQKRILRRNPLDQENGQLAETEPADKSAGESVADKKIDLAVTRETEAKPDDLEMREPEAAESSKTRRASKPESAPKPVSDPESQPQPKREHGPKLDLDSDFAPAAAEDSSTVKPARKKQQ